MYSKSLQWTIRKIMKIYKIYRALKHLHLIVRNDNSHETVNRIHKYLIASVVEQTSMQP